jgi:hypothetical protein
MPNTQDEIYSKLQELIDVSPALQTLPEEERNERRDAMMGSTPEQMQHLIKIFEDEQLRMKQIDEDFEGHEQEINEFISNSKVEKKNFDRSQRKEKENTVKVNDEKYAEDLLKKLDEVV